MRRLLAFYKKTEQNKKMQDQLQVIKNGCSCSGSLKPLGLTPLTFYLKHTEAESKHNLSALHTCRKWWGERLFTEKHISELKPDCVCECEWVWGGEGLMTSGTLKRVDKSQTLLPRQDSSPRQTRITVYHQHIHPCAGRMMDPSSLKVIGYDRHFRSLQPSIIYYWFPSTLGPRGSWSMSCMCKCQNKKL